jgi:PHD/YefM family antitoxin component YafN of YafNO toxin-antitoxin module
MQHYKLNSKEKLNKDEYIRMQIRLAFLLRDDLSDDENLEDLRFTIDEDWEHDSHG